MVPVAYKSRPACPPELNVIDAISGKWTVLLVHILSERAYRHSELQRIIPSISQKMLTQSLRTLERHGIVERMVYPVVPPRVEYSLTPLGESLVDLLSGICMWAQAHQLEVKKARLAYETAVARSIPASVDVIDR